MEEKDCNLDKDKGSYLGEVAGAFMLNFRMTESRYEVGGKRTECSGKQMTL
jgi:hypothetical protein